MCSAPPRSDCSSRSRRTPRAIRKARLLQRRVIWKLQLSGSCLAERPTGLCASARIYLNLFYSDEQGLFYGSSKQTIGESLQALCALRGFLQEFFPVVRRMAAGQHRLENPIGIALAAVDALGVGVVDPAQDN